MRTIIFDLDGTLADTSGDLIAAANACFARAGLGDVLDPVADQKTAFEGGKAMLRLGFSRAKPDWTEQDIEAHYPDLLRYYGEHIDTHTQLYHGVIAALKRLHASGAPLGICTNKPAALAEILLTRLGIRHYFTAMLGADSLPIRKPDPEHLRETIRQAGGDLDHAVLIGDTMTDRATAAAANIPCILVTFGPHDRDVQAMRPDALLDHFDQLEATLTQLPAPRAAAQKTRFTGSFTQQLPIPSDAIKAAVAVMQTGRLHRYNVADGETGEAALLEQEFATEMGAKYCLAVASGGAALSISLRAIGVKPDQTVLTNAFTLAPVPGAIANIGASPAFVDVTDDLVIDLKHLSEMIEKTDARVLMLSHMRGHICHMERLMEICDHAGVQVIEDCAHTMGARWNGTLSGRFGQIGCYSTQTYKHMNSGEGGLIISDDAEAMARATMLSGSYMLYERHRAGPDAATFQNIRLETPNCSARMDNLRAAILRPQLHTLARNCAAWTERYRVVEAALRGTKGLKLIARPDAESFVGSSIQFLLPAFSPAQITALIASVAARGVELKWFGAAQPQGFTSRYDSWTYAPKQRLPQTDRILDGLMDMRLPLTFSLSDCALIGAIIREEVSAINVA